MHNHGTFSLSDERPEKDESPDSVTSIDRDPTDQSNPIPDQDRLQIEHDDGYDVCLVTGGQDVAAMAQQLYQRLSANGLRSWFNAATVASSQGSLDRSKQQTAIEQSYAIAILFSAGASGSSHELRQVVDWALDYGKYIIPLIVSDNNAPDDTSGDGESYRDVAHLLSARSPSQWISVYRDFSNIEEVVVRISNGLTEQKSNIQQHTHYLLQALQWYRHERRSPLLLPLHQSSTAREWLITGCSDDASECCPSPYHAEFITESIKQAHHGMTQVFMSYSDEDRAIKERLQNNLRKRGITVWSNETDIKTGEDFQEAINRGIEQTDTVILLMSPQSLTSAFCQKEIRYAQLYHKRIIPLLIADLRPADIPVDLQTLQFVDFKTIDTDKAFRASASALFRVLEDDAEYYNTHKTLLVKALEWDHHERRQEFLLRGNAFVDAENWLQINQQTAKQPPPTRLHISFIESSRQINRYFDAFISYGRKDSLDFAIALDESLSQQGFNVWLDKTDIPLGVDFQQQINDGLAKAHNFIFIISPHSVNSSYCKREIELALQFQKRIVPLLHVEAISYETWQQRNPQGTPQDWQNYQEQGLHSIVPNMNPTIGKINWVYFREGVDNYRQSLDSLIAVFPRHRTYVEQHTIYLVKALSWERQQHKTEHLLVGDERLEAEGWLKTQFDDEQPPCLPTQLHAEFICESIKNSDNLMTQVFISHAEADHHVREKVRYSLMCQGLTVWINRTDITTGTDFQAEINRGIEETDNVVWLMSSASLASAYCREELEYALLLKKRIIPLLIDAIDIEDLPAGLRSLQFIDCRNFEQPDAYHHAINKLLKTLWEDARYHNQHKLLLVKALRWKHQEYNPSILLRGIELRHFQSWFQAANQHPQFRPTPLQEEFIAESEQQPPDTTLNVFIAYSRSDGDFARKLNQTLQIQGMTTWFDQENIESGEDFRTEIFQGIENSENFLFIISPSSVISSFCNEEVEYAKRLNKRIVTVLYREVSVALLPSTLADLQWIDFRRHGGDFLDNFGELLRTLASDPMHVRMHTRLLVRSREWKEADRDDSYLMRGRDLEQAIAWVDGANTREPRPIPLQHEYIEASKALPLRRIKPRIVVFSSMAATIIVAIARFFGLTEGLELLAYDQLLRMRLSEPQDDRITLVTVDSRSARDLRSRTLAGGYEPGFGTIPDEALSEALANLQQHGPRLIGLDIYRDFPANTGLAIQLRQMDNLIGICKNPATDERSDASGAVLTDVFGNAVEGYQPPPELSLDKVGFSDLLDDGRSVVRRHYLHQRPDEADCNVREAMSLVLAKNYLQQEKHTYTSPLAEDDLGLFYIRDGLMFGDASIPMLLGNGSGFQNRLNRLRGYQTLLNFRIHDQTLESFATVIPFQAVLDNQMIADDIRDRIILIGYTDLADRNTDFWNTPYGPAPGVVLQGQMVSQLLSHVLDGRSLIWWWPVWLEYLWAASWGLVAGFSVWWLYRAKWLVTAGVISVIILIGTCYIVLATLGGWLALIPAAIVMGLTAGSVIYLNNRIRMPN